MAGVHAGEGDAAAWYTAALGEAFVYAVFSKLLPGFGRDNWHSGNRCCLGLPQPDREPSYDFLSEDVQGVLTDRAGTLWFIEVKSTRFDGINPMCISRREWELAQKVILVMGLQYSLL
jgi:hypothetical protein